MNEYVIAILPIQYEYHIATSIPVPDFKIYVRLTTHNLSLRITRQAFTSYTGTDCSINLLPSLNQLTNFQNTRKNRNN